MKNKNILIIEDEKDVRENIRILLEEENYFVDCACSGKEGIKLAREKRPDLIICDIMMKEIDGYEVLKTLAKEKETKSIPFIFLTAKVERDDIRKGMELGADDYLFKPYKADELLAAIDARFKRIQMLTASFDKKNEESTKRYNYNDKIFIKIDNHPHILKINEILYIAAENQYTSVHLTIGKSFLIRKSISNWENILPENEFLRIHRSTIINMEHIIKMGKWDNSSLLVYLDGVEKPFIISKRNSSKLRHNNF
jgi:DNA-binding LytR/AlgR family response regulator